MRLTTDRAQLPQLIARQGSRCTVEMRQPRERSLVEIERNCSRLVSRRAPSEHIVDSLEPLLDLDTECLERRQQRRQRAVEVGEAVSPPLEHDRQLLELADETPPRVTNLPDFEAVERGTVQQPREARLRCRCLRCRISQVLGRRRT